METLNFVALQRFGMVVRMVCFSHPGLRVSIYDTYRSMRQFVVWMGIYPVFIISYLLINTGI